MPCKLVLVLREDYLAFLYSYENLLPTLFDFRLRVEPMSERNLREVIVGTCAGAGIGLIDPEETLRLILSNNQNARSTFQLPYLQVYLDRLWRSACEAGSEEPLAFDPSLVQRVGAIDDVLERFLDEQKAAVGAALTPADRPAVGRVLEAFVTYEGTRQEQSAEGLQENTGLEPVLVRRVLNDLEKVRLLRQEDGRYELAHDSLAKVVDKNRSAEQRQVNDVLRRLKDEYRVYRKNGVAADLLTPRRLTEIQLVEEALRPELDRSTPDAGAVWQFVGDSRDFHQRQQRQKLARLRLTIGIMIGLLIVAGVGIALALREWERSNVKNVVFQADAADPLNNLIMSAWANEKDDDAITTKSLYEVFYNRRAYSASLTPPTPIAQANFTPGNDGILTVGANQKAYLWDQRGERLRDSIQLPGGIVDYRFARQGQSVVFLTETGAVYRWDRRRPPVRLGGANQRFQTASFSPDGRQILTSSPTGQGHLWSGSGALLGSLPATVPPGTAAFLDNQTLLVQTPQGEAFLWTIRSDSAPLRVPLSGQLVNVQVADDGQRAVFLTADGAAYLWLRPGNRLRPLAQGQPVVAALLSANGQTAMTQEGQTTYRWNGEGVQLGSLEFDEPARLEDLAPDGRTFLTISATTQVQHWSREGVRLDTYRHLQLLKSARFAPDGGAVLSLTETGRAYRWDCTDPRFAALTHPENVQRLRLATQADVVLTGTATTLYRWNRRGLLLDSLPCPEPVMLTEVSPNGQAVFTVSETGTARLWTRSGTAPAVLPLPMGLTDAHFSPDGNRILYVSETGRAGLWDRSTRRATAFRREGVETARFSPDGNSVLLMNTASGTVSVVGPAGTLLALDHPGATVQTAAFIDSTQLLTLTNRGDLTLWDRRGQRLRSVRRAELIATEAVPAPGGRKVLLFSPYAKNAYVCELTDLEITKLPHGAEVQTAFFAGDENQIVTQVDNHLRLWTSAGESILHLNEPCTLATFSDRDSALVTVLGTRAMVWPGPLGVGVWMK
ncbi:MAG: WD40 repeat domain-containing protein, partial [Sphingobacteriaceae bacterium]|nr:WD40 repeat domain-containing protein [Cytophagaceae bacterium]